MESFAHWLLLSIVERFDCGTLEFAGNCIQSTEIDWHYYDINHVK